jgi:hypothetical protein
MAPVDPGSGDLPYYGTYSIALTVIANGFVAKALCIEGYSKLPVKMIKQVCDLRRRAEGNVAAEGSE